MASDTLKSACALTRKSCDHAGSFYLPEPLPFAAKVELKRYRRGTQRVRVTGTSNEPRERVMKIAIALLLLTTSVMGQTEEQFKQNRLALDFSKIGTSLLPEGLEDAPDLSAVKTLRVKAAEHEVEALQARYERGLENINFLLDARIRLAVAQLDTTDSKEEQLKFIEVGLYASIMTWQRLKELQKVGARGGDAAAEAQARSNVYRFYVWWHKWKAGEPIGVTLTR